MSLKPIPARNRKSGRLLGSAMRIAPLAACAALFIVLLFGSGAAREGFSIVVPTTADNRWDARFQELEAILGPVELLPQSVLGREANVLTALQTGFSDFAISSAATLTELDERFLVADLPFVAVDPSISGEALDVSGVSEVLKEAAEAHGLTILGRFARPSVLGSRTSCVETPEQLAGDRVIAFGTVRALLIWAGADPISIPPGEISLAVERGLAEKALVPAETAHYFRLAETWNCMTHSSSVPLVHSWSFFVANSSAYDRLGDEEKRDLESQIVHMFSEEEISQRGFVTNLETAMASRDLADLDANTWQELGQSHYKEQAAIIADEAAILVHVIARRLAEE